MEMPKLVYHGTFWPDGTELSSEGLRTSYVYVSATPDRRWARYFAWHKRWEHREQPGTLAVYEIDTDKLPEEVRERCIPPDGVDPRATGAGGWLQQEEGMKEERIRVGDFRFPHIPLVAIVGTEEEPKDAQPDLNVFTVVMLQPV